MQRGPGGHWRSVTAVTWRRDAWRVRLAANGVSGFESVDPETALTVSVPSVPTYFNWEASAAWSDPRYGTFSLEVFNLFDRAPPLHPFGLLGVAFQQHDLLGQRWQVRWSRDWE